jgi:translocation and assembly module TamB
MIRRGLLLLVLLLASALAWFSVDRVSAQVGSDAVSDLLSWALSTPTTQVSIGSVEGALSSDVTIRDVKVADRDGVWLTLDRARLVWNRSALFSRRLDIEALDVGTLTLLRRPQPSDPEAVAGPPSLPELPVKLIVRAFQLTRFDLAEPVLGAAAQLTSRGSAELGPPAEGLKLDFSAQRLDAAARFVVRLGYVPATTQLHIDVDLDEAAGGLVSRALSIPGLPPIRLIVAGQGPLDDWSGELSFAASAEISAKGQARLRRAGAGRDLDLDLSARIGGLLPEAIAPVFAGATTLAGSIGIGDDGALAIRKLDLLATAATLSITGSVDAQRIADLRLTAGAVPTEGTLTRAGAARIDRLSLQAALTGALTAPSLSGKLEAAGVRLPSLSLAALSSQLALTPLEAPPGGPRFTIAFDATVNGLALSDPALNEAVGSTLSVSGRGTLDAGFVADFSALVLTSETVQARLAGQVGYRRLDGQAEISVPRLQPFSGLAGTPLAGSAWASARLTGNPSVARLRADLDASASDLATGQARLDALLGRTVTLKGGMTRLALGFAFDSLELAGAHLRATLDGVATEDAASVKALLLLPELQRLDPRLSGRAQAQAHLTGSLRRPDLRASAEILDATLLGRRVPALTLQLAAQNLRQDLTARLTLSGDIDNNPASGRLTLRREGAGWRLEDLDFRLGSVLAMGAVTLDTEGLAAGSLSLQAGDLDDLSPLVLTPLAGSLAASADLAVAAGGQDAALKAEGSAVRIGDWALQRLAVALTLRDIYRQPRIDGQIDAASLVAFGQHFERIRLTAKGSPAGSDLDLAATSAGFDLTARGRLLPGAPTRFELAAFEARRGGRRIDLAQPARFALADGAVAIEGLVLRIETGRLALDGRLGRAIDLALEARAVPLSAAEIVRPGLGLGGRLDGTARVSGPATAPGGSYRLTVKGLTSAATRAAGVPAADLTVAGQLSNGRIGVEASLSVPRSGVLRATGSLPLSPTGALDLTLRGPVELALFSTPLAARGQALRGRLSLDMRVQGTLAKPAFGGNASLAQGSFNDYLRGVRIEAIAGRFLAQGDVLGIERLSASTPNGGTLQATGRITLDPAAGFPADIRLTGTRAQLVSDTLMAVVANLSTTLSGPLLTAPRLAGQVELVSVEIDIAGGLSGFQGPLPGTRHVKPPPEARALLALEQRSRAERIGPPFAVALDLALNAPDSIHVRGRGLNATLGGRLRLAGTSAAPVPTGAFLLRQGALSLPGRRIDITQGSILFAGDLRPTLDFIAESQAGGVTARIAVTGPANAPDFVVTSAPALPQDEVLSRLLFGKPAGGLSGFQALQLAQTVAVLSGGAGAGGLDGVRRSLGLDALDLSTSSSGDPTAGLSRALSRDVRVSVEAGSKTDASGVRVDMGLGGRLRLQGTVGIGGGTSIGVGTEWEY